jgi:hypothetical protein
MGTKAAMGRGRGEVIGPEEPRQRPFKKSYSKRRSRKPPFGIEVRYPSFTFAQMHEWHGYKWYETEKQRDRAFESLTRKKVGYSREFRKAVR